MLIHNFYNSLGLNLKNSTLSLTDANNNVLKRELVTADEIIVGKPLFEDDPVYSVQYSTTQGIPALEIYNHYDVPIMVNDRILQPRCKIRYKGRYDNGIPYGEILKSTYDENVVVTVPATNLHYGLYFTPT